MPIPKRNKVDTEENITAVEIMVPKPVVSLNLNKITNFLLYTLVLVIPMLFLPFTSEVLDFNKQALLFFAVVIMLGAWMVRILMTRKVSWIKTPLDYILLAYFLAYFFTSIFSIDQASSFLGYYGRFTGSFVSTVIFIALYYLIVNNVKTKDIVSRLTKYILTGTGLVFVYSLLQLLGFFTLPVDLTHNSAFNTIGSLASLSIYVAIGIVFLQWLWLCTHASSKLGSVVLGVLTIVGLLIMLLINSFLGWLTLVFGIIVLLALSMVVFARENAQISRFWKPMIVFFVAILFLAFQFLPPVLNPRNFINVNLPTEVQLSNKITWDLVANSFKSGAKQTILGSGPGTFGVVFGDIKPVELNKTPVWNVNLDRASNEVANIAIESGVLGLLIFEGMAIFFIFYGLRFLLKKRPVDQDAPEEEGGNHQRRVMALGFFVVWLALYISHFLYFYTTTSYFLYWLSLALFVAIVSWPTSPDIESQENIASSPHSTIPFMFISLLILVALIIGGLFEVAVYGAEAAYAAGVRILNDTKPDFMKVSDNLKQATVLNQYRDVYLLGYGQSLLFLASEEAAKPNPDINKIQTWVQNAVNAGKNATQISPERASNWAALAQLYDRIRALVPGADQFAIQSWQEAIKRDSKNPILYMQLARDFDAGGMFEQAENALNKAIELKNDLPDFYIQLSRILEKEGKLALAKEKLDEAVRIFSTNADVRFEQGRITYNQKNYAEAESIFLEVIRLVPNNANAHYSLGLLYSQQGNKDKALVELKKTLEIVGSDTNVEKLINSLSDVGNASSSAKKTSSTKKNRKVGLNNAQSQK